jgi:hypothetical protein
MNTKVEAPTIYQGSTSVISVVTNGRGIVKTNHLRVRMNLAKEAAVGNIVVLFVCIHTKS